MSGFLEDNEGNKSLTRILSAITCLTGLAIGIIIALKGNATAGAVTISTSFVGAGLGIKALGKKLEK